VVWLMRDYFQSVPVELEESAAIDGASPYRIFARSCSPSRCRAWSRRSFFVLVFAWNEYLIALFLTKRERPDATDDGPLRRTPRADLSGGTCRCSS